MMSPTFVAATRREDERALDILYAWQRCVIYRAMHTIEVCSPCAVVYRTWLCGGSIGDELNPLYQVELLDRLNLNREGCRDKKYPCIEKVLSRLQGLGIEREVQCDSE
jgi:hypothetical protein